ncbi:N-terminus of Esterase_SGNH_hydro-type [Zhouia amylolytica]|uniref:N-terminus of Esterase_SGNH_hydro-type n=1 Tax=Zhouia amylolytica TaxID=376730 RepID=A0A1I6UCX7_9FLAO|nr:SGNH/GDSL hydrolase family protein [Zhouia amylolytica]SFS99339.1 N-terminus of Esterase_SGNH_hydro-type [Zhouia amylolytica]
MKSKFFLFLVVVGAFCGQMPLVFSQAGYTWKDGREFKIYGQLDDTNISYYKRLPDTLERHLRAPLWKLSEQASGLYIKFKTNTSSVSISYQVENPIAFPHMPSTGVSGVDLYAKSGDTWQWVSGNFSFKDTISYHFKGISSDEERMYRLYLPLYNQIKWLKVGVDSNAVFQAIVKKSSTNPIIIYGTSIAQGACASRAGMAWTNILERTIDLPIINLGFSGNGRLEDPVINYIKRFDASMFIFDCMPNFTSGQGLNPIQARIRLKKAVLEIRSKHVETPILLVEHAGYSDAILQTGRKTIYENLNREVVATFKELQSQGIKNLYLLSREEIGLGGNSFVDGTHPNDLGMYEYASAYGKKIKNILD